jgi:hypothetical protein
MNIRSNIVYNIYVLGKNVVNLYHLLKDIIELLKNLQT